MRLVKVLGRSLPHPFGSVALHRWRHVCVDLPGHVGARVVEALGDDLDIDALGERQRRPGVTQTVEHEAGVAQMGELEEVVANDGKSFYFSHAPVERSFEYLEDTRTAGRIETPAYYWDQDDVPAPGKLPTYTPIGPFASWRITLRDNELKNPVDWSTSTGVRMEFHIRHTGFDGG